MNEGKKDRPWPVLVTAGDKHTAALMNRKAYRKSVETGSPWVVHPITGRILPWPGSPRDIFLTEGSGSFVLVIPEGSHLQPYGPALPEDADPDDRSEMNPATNDDGTVGNAVNKSDNSQILNRLSDIIVERQRTMPEGSYTTHLFSAGADKIRKKVGEEAVELILARESHDVIYETADLIFHIQVLLESLGLKWIDVEMELARRFSK